MSSKRNRSSIAPASSASSSSSKRIVAVAAVANDDFHVGDAIFVLWEESGVRFPATIRSINSHVVVSKDDDKTLPTFDINDYVEQVIECRQPNTTTFYPAKVLQVRKDSEGRDTSVLIQWVDAGTSENLPLDFQLMKIISAKRSRTPINSSGSLSDGNKVAAVTYDVLYDELVRGQQCVEKNVPAHRLVSSKQLLGESAHFGEGVPGSPSRNKLRKEMIGKATIKNVFKKSITDVIEFLAESACESFTTNQAAAATTAAMPSPSPPDPNPNSNSDAALHTPNHTPNSAALVTAPTPVVADLEDIASAMELTPQQALLVHNYLSASHISDMVDKTPKTLALLTSLLAKCVMAEEVSMNFEEFCNENSSEGMANIKALFGESGLGAAHIDMCSSAIASGCVLLRIMSFVAANNIGFSLHASANVSLSDEVVERVLQLSNSFLQYNISVPGTGNSRNTSLNSSKKRKPNGDGDSDGDESGDERDAINFNDDENNIVSKSKATKKQGKKGSKIKDSSQKTLLSFTLPVFIPLVRTLLYSLESFLSLRRQNERLCILAYELAVNVLRTDRSSNFKAGQVDPPGAALLVSLHYAAVVLMRCIFRKYPSCRQSMLLEFLPLFTQIYSPKHFGKDYFLQSISGLSSVATTALYSSYSVSMTFAGLMISLQSAVSSAGGVAAVSASTPTDAYSPVDSAEVSKHALSDIYRMCASFLSELFKRCSHKDTSSEFRNVATQILNEVFVALPAPKLPIVGLFLDQFVKRIHHELNTHLVGKEGISKGVDKEDNRKDSSYITFLMDLVGVAGTGYRSFSQRSDSNYHNITNNIRLSDESKKVVISRLFELRPSIQQSITKTADASSKHSSPQKKISPKKEGSAALASSSASNGKMDVGLALSVSSQVKAISLDAMAHHQIGSSASRSGIGTVVPSLTLIFRDCLIDDDPTTLALVGDVLSAMPPLEEPDEHFFALLAYLESEESLPVSSLLCGTFDDELTAESKAPSRKTSSTPDLPDLGTATKGNSVRDAYDLFLAQWHALSSAGSRGAVARLALNLLSNSAASASSYLCRTSDGQLLTRDRCENSVLSGAVFSSVGSRANNPNLKSATRKLSLLSLGEGERRGFLSYDAAQSAYLSLLAETTFRVQFDFLLNCLLLQFGDPSPIVRARVLKTLHTILECDPEVIRREAVRDAITERFNDIAISVREEAVKLVGSFTLKGKDISAGYVDALLVRLKDKGVSVRKAVVNIIRDILVCQPEHPRYTVMCLALVEKASLAKEEESIKDVIRSTFQQLWFLPSAGRGVSSGVNPSPNTSPRGDRPYYVVSPAKGDDDNAEGSAASSENVVGGGGSSEGTLSSLDISATATAVETSIYSPEQDVATSPVNAKSSIKKNDQWRNQQNKSQLNTSTAAVKHTTVTANHIKAVTGQIVDLIMHIDNYAWMVVLIREMLHGKSTGMEASVQVKARRMSSFSQCDSLVAHMMDLLMLSEEKLDKGRIIAVISTLAVFSAADPLLLVKHVWALTPYLKADNGFNAADEALVCVKVIDILAATVVVQGVVFHTGIGDIARDLISIALNFGGRCLDSAISCLSLLCCHHFKDITLLLGLFNKCYGAIVYIAKSFTGSPSIAQLSNQQSAQLQRCLLVIGKVCEHSRMCLNLIRSFYSSNVTTASKNGLDILTWEEDVEYARRDVRALPMKLVSPCGMYGACFSAVVYALALPNIQIQRFSAQCLCGVVIGCSRLMLVAEDIGIIKKLLGDSTHEAVLEKFLQALKDMMFAEEARLEHGQAILDLKEAGVDMGSKVIGGNTTGDGDAAAAGFALQQHLPELMAITSSHFGAVRFACLELLGVMLRQGLVCPLDIVPLLVALQGDPEAAIRRAALQYLLIEDEKHPTFLDNRVADGLELAYTHQLKVGGGVHPLELLATASANNTDGLGSDAEVDLALESSSTVTSIFSQVYALCIQPSRKRRSDFISSVLRKINNLIESINSSAFKLSTGRFDAGNNKTRGRDELTVNGCAHVLSIITFLVSTVAHLPFEFSEEPLQIVYWINRNIPLASSMLLGLMKKELLIVGGVTAREEGRMQPPMFGSAPKKSKQNFASASSELVSDSGLLFAAESFRSLAADTKRDDFCEGSDDKSRFKVQQRLELVLVKAAEARALESLLRLKSYLKIMFTLSDEKCSLYSPNDTIASSSTSVTEKVRLFESLGVYTALPASLPPTYRDIFLSNFDSELSSDISASVAIVATAVGDYNRLASTLDSDPVDFTLSKKDARKRKKQLDEKSGVAGSSPPGKGSPVGKKAKAAPKTRKKKKLTLSRRQRGNEYDDGDDDDNDDDDDDDDYLGDDYDGM